MRSLDKTVILMISRVFASANVLILSIFFARMLTKAEYGTYIQFNMIIQLTSLLLLLGIPASLFYFLPQNTNRKFIIFRSLGMVLLLGILSLLIINIFKYEICVFLNNNALLNHLPLVGICLICVLCFNMIRSLLMVQNAPLTLAKITIFINLSLFASMISCLYLKLGLNILIFIFTINYILQFIIAIYIIFKCTYRFPEEQKIIKISLKEQLKYAIPLAASEFLWLIGRETDKYIISHFMDPAQLAVYSRGAVEIPLVYILASTLADVYLPKWVQLSQKKEYSQLIASWHTTVIKTALILFAIFSFMQIVAYDFIVLLYSEQYIGSVVIFSIYLFILPIKLTHYTAIIQTSGKTKYILYGYVFQISFNIIMSSIFIRYWGSIAPALFTVISMYIFSGYLLYMISTIFNIPIKKIFPWKFLLKLLGINIITGSIVFIIKGFINIINPFTPFFSKELSLFFNIMCAGIVFLVVHIILLLKYNMMEREVKATIVRWLTFSKIGKLLPWFNK